MLSPLLAIGGAVFFYAQHCKARSERGRRNRGPLAAAGAMLLTGALILLLPADQEAE